MKKLYLILIIALQFVGFSCSKDFLKSYDSRIEGTWRLTDTKKFGFGSTTPIFQEGLFTFSDNGQIAYSKDGQDTATGSWNIRRRWVQGNCYSDDEGNRNCNNRYIRSLNISVFHLTTQQLQAEYFDEIVFTGTNRFKAFIYTGAGTYVFYFRRQ